MEDGDPLNDSVIQEQKSFLSRDECVGFIFGLIVGLATTGLGMFIFKTLKSL